MENASYERRWPKYMERTALLYSEWKQRDCTTRSDAFIAGNKH
jgi:hypothetical protein